MFICKYFCELSFAYKTIFLSQIFTDLDTKERLTHPKRVFFHDNLGPCGIHDGNNRELETIKAGNFQVYSTFTNFVSFWVYMSKGEGETSIYCLDRLTFFPSPPYIR